MGAVACEAFIALGVNFRECAWENCQFPADKIVLAKMQNLFGQSARLR
jgi:hypothetical protein